MFVVMYNNLYNPPVVYQGIKPFVKDHYLNTKIGWESLHRAMDGDDNSLGANDKMLMDLINAGRAMRKKVIPFAAYKQWVKKSVESGCRLNPTNDYQLAGWELGRFQVIHNTHLSFTGNSWSPNKPRIECSLLHTCMELKAAAHAHILEGCEKEAKRLYVARQLILYIEELVSPQATDLFLVQCDEEIAIRRPRRVRAGMEVFPTESVAFEPHSFRVVDLNLRAMVSKSVVLEFYATSEMQVKGLTANVVLDTGMPISVTIFNAGHRSVVVPANMAIGLIVPRKQELSF